MAASPPPTARATRASQRMDAAMEIFPIAAKNG